VRAFGRETPLMLAVLVMVVGLAVIVLGDWRAGSRMIGGAVLLAGVLRLVLHDEQAGMLAVRGKAVDVTTMALLGTAVLALAAVVPA
jgi:hypothetical protein